MGNIRKGLLGTISVSSGETSVRAAGLRCSLSSFILLLFWPPAGSSLEAHSSCLWYLQRQRGYSFHCLLIPHKASSRTEQIQACWGQTTPEWMGAVPAHSLLLVAVASPSWETAVGPEEKGRLLHSSQGAVDLGSTLGSYAGSGR